jgi:hypothetical protein
MSIFGSIMSKVFGHHPETAHPTASAATPAQPAGTSSPAPSAPAPTPAAPAATPSAPTSSAPAPSTAPAPAADAKPTVDIAAVLDGMESHAGQKLDWRHSIVDLMKLLGLDSSHSARVELAHELHYTGDIEDSAAMNIWLHKEVMIKFTENGGKLPPDLAH